MATKKAYDDGYSVFVYSRVFPASEALVEQVTFTITPVRISITTASFIIPNALVIIEIRSLSIETMSRKAAPLCYVDGYACSSVIFDSHGARLPFQNQ